MLSGCSEASYTGEQNGLETIKVINESTNLLSGEQVEASPEAYIPEGIGGDFRECYIHSWLFCGHSLHSIGVFAVGEEAFEEWFLPLRAQRSSPYDECLANLSTLIEHFGISREVFQELVNNNPFMQKFWLIDTADILFSGDKALIEQYFRFENEELHHQMAMEHEIRYFSERFQIAQSVVDANTTGMSRYYHDIWTYAMLTEHGIRWFYNMWMRDLVAAGEYERVNIVDFVDHFFGENREAFERWVNEHSMYLHTHYNLDIIFSGNPQLIASYYAIENESIHTAQINQLRQQHGLQPLLTHYQLSFILCGEAAMDTIQPINIPIGVNILDYLMQNHNGFPEQGPIRQDYRFLGWYLDSDFTTPITDTFRMPARDTTLYARWEQDDRQPTPPTIQKNRISVGDEHSISIMTDRSLWGWGNNLQGQLGDGTNMHRHNPIHIMDDAIAVSAGWVRTMAIRGDGSLWGWGNNGNGQLGDGTYIQRFSPVRIMDDVIAVSAGSTHTMAIRDDGSLWGWGNNWSGQLGGGAASNYRTPIWIVDDVIAVSAGAGHTMAIRSDGSLWAWGNNWNGQLGDGTTIDRHIPTLIKGEGAEFSAFDFDVTIPDQRITGTEAGFGHDSVTISWGSVQGSFIMVTVTHPDGTTWGPFAGGSVRVPAGSDANFYVIPEHHQANRQAQFTVDYINISGDAVSHIINPLDDTAPATLTNELILGETSVLAAQIFDITDHADITFVITHN